MNTLGETSGLSGLGIGDFLGDFEVESILKDVAKNTVGAGAALGAVIAVNKVSDMLPQLGHDAVKPFLKMVLGALAGPYIGRAVGRGKYTDLVGPGISIGLTLSGAVGVLNAFQSTAGLIPAFAGLGASNDALLLADHLGADNVYIESGSGVGADNVFAEPLSGDNVGVERVSRLGGIESVLGGGGGSY